MEVIHRAGEEVLARVFGGAGHDALLCAIEGRNGDLSFAITWSGNTTFGTDEAIAAAASLFDRYLVSGHGLAP